MRLLIFAFLSFILINTKLYAENQYYQKLPADFIKKINFENPGKLRFDHTPENYNTVVNLIQEAKEESLAIHYLCDILDTNKSIEMVPAIMRIVDDQKIVFKSFAFWDGPSGSGTFDINNNVATFMVKILENFYAFSLDIDETTNIILEEVSNNCDISSYDKQDSYLWKKLWQKDSKNYKKWGADFYRETLHKYQKADSLSHIQLNYIFESNDRRDKDSTIWKSLLNKVKVSEHFYLKTDNIFKIDSLDQVQHLMGNLESFTEIIQNINDLKIVSFKIIHSALSTFNEIDQGEIISILLKNEAIQKAIIANPKRLYLADSYIENKVYKFRDHDSKLEPTHKYHSPFKNLLEEKSGGLVKDFAILNNFDILNPPLYFVTMEKMDTKAKICYIMDTLIGRIEKEQFQKLLKTATYKDLSVIIQNHPKFSRKYPYWDMFEILTFSIGISMEKYTQTDFPALLRILNKYDEYTFFKRHAKKLYPKLFSQEDLNYQLISKELKSPSALKYDKENKLEFSPILTLIRILELEHNTRLGFKYQFERYNPKSVQKRINAWIEYLRDKGLIDKEIK